MHLGDAGRVPETESGDEGMITQMALMWDIERRDLTT
jgi:hypothetical protein